MYLPRIVEHLHAQAQQRQLELEGVQLSRGGEAAVDVAARSGAQPYPLLAAAAGQPQVSKFAAEVGTSRSSPLARARLSGEAAVFVGALILYMI